jgi:hypothetical protein
VAAAGTADRTRAVFFSVARVMSASGPPLGEVLTCDLREAGARTEVARQSQRSADGGCNWR